MLVYGDASITESPNEKRARIVEAAREAVAMAGGIERHGALVAAFIEAGELAQGIADAAFAEQGHDASTPAQDRAMALLMELAGIVRLSWQSGFRRIAPLSAKVIGQREAAPWSESICVKRPEGYAFYALYPEAYLEAAVALAPLGGKVQVIGIRSIGTGLAAMVATALGAPAPVTVRPVGHPFRRELALSPELAAALRAEPEARFAVVDEGPGLSGSSFGTVADFLEDQRVTPEHIHFFPSHIGDLGPQASPRHRARWAKAARHVVDFDMLVLGANNPAHRLESWVADLVGAPEAPLDTLSGGAWRQRAYGEDQRPPAHVQQERRKYLLRTATGSWLLRFAGLGREGGRKLDRARALFAAGFTPEVLGYRHGFLVERWIEDARPLDFRAVDRGALVGFVGRYLGFRARAFPAGPEQGASLNRLFEMARANTAEALGEARARRLDRFAPDLPELERRVRRIETDNRLHAWEWLQCADGRLLKTDALDHHAAHDLVGCQDVAWDVAGAMVELDLSDAEAQTLSAVIAHETGRAVDPGLLAVCRPCYLAFQTGYHALAADALVGCPDEAARLRAASDCYAARLRGVLAERF
jgi:hypothetical protein